MTRRREEADLLLRGIKGLGTANPEEETSRQETDRVRVELLKKDPPSPPGGEEPWTRSWMNCPREGGKTTIRREESSSWSLEGKVAEAWARGLFGRESQPIIHRGAED